MVTKHDNARTVLLVEDDPSLAMGLSDALSFEGYHVVHAKSGTEAVQQFGTAKPDCVILDLMLPDINGFQVCERIRRLNSHIPVIMLTARSEEADKIRGLDAGADDYVTKPFSVGELVARLRALLRRAERDTVMEPPFWVGGILVDTNAHTLTEGSKVTHLSYYESMLLAYLYQHRGKPRTREEILENIWGVQPSPYNRTVDNFIVKLRKKLEPYPEKPRYLLTVHGMGYKLIVAEPAQTQS
ncbi:MAG: response regulator transcription factor [Myxococcales bacterium]|nr:response regulator transcription factor [Myxococcales bacterium]MCB9708092.1 response regulator transcription factor [Myxococcales bacterium]